MMKNPFDTGIRMTVVRTPGRTTCSVDEFVSCPTNARADAAERALAQIASAMACKPDDDADLVEAVRLLVHERAEVALERAEVARLTAEVEGLTAERDHYRVALHAHEARRG